MNRKTFLSLLVTAGLASVAPASFGPRSLSAALSRSMHRFGVQLYTVRVLMQEDVPRTLQAVADVGYQEVQTAGLLGLTPALFREALDRAGLVSPASHVSLGRVRSEPEAILDEARVLGQHWIVVPSIGGNERTPEGYRRVAEDLNRFGELAERSGMRAGYHNHDFEFTPLPDGTNGYDVLLAHTDPDRVDMELDLFWAIKGGCDPLDLFEAHPGRFPLWHVKDMADIGGTEQMVSVGEGEIDFAAIFRRAEQSGLRHFFVEHDNPPDPMESIRIGFGHLQEVLANL